MKLESLDIFLYTSIFLLPGYIINEIINTLNPPKRNNSDKLFLTYLSLSIINCAIWSWLYYIVFKYINKEKIIFWVILVFITVIGSFIVGLSIGIVKQKKWILCIADKLGIRNINPIPSAWDYFFAQQSPAWVIITLIDNTQIAGLYSSNSFASSDIEERDIYIEKAYKLIETDGGVIWEENKKSTGVLITKEQIKFIEFYKGED